MNGWKSMIWSAFSQTSTFHKFSSSRTASIPLWIFMVSRLFDGCLKETSILLHICQAPTILLYLVLTERRNWLPRNISLLHNFDIPAKKGETYFSSNMETFTTHKKKERLRAGSFWRGVWGEWHFHINGMGRNFIETQSVIFFLAFFVLSSTILNV